MCVVLVCDGARSWLHRPCVRFQQILTTRAMPLAAPTQSQGDTPLHVACRHNQPAVVELLLKKGADTAIKNKQVCFASCGCF